MNQKDYVVLSLELHLFFARIMKEHSLFLQAAFTPAEKDCADEAASFRIRSAALFSIGRTSFNTQKTCLFQIKRQVSFCSDTGRAAHKGSGKSSVRQRIQA